MTITTDLSIIPLKDTSSDTPFKGMVMVYGRVEMDIAADGTVEGLYIDDLLAITEADIALGALEQLDQLRAFDEFTAEDLDHIDLLLGLDRMELIAIALGAPEADTALAA